MRSRTESGPTKVAGEASVTQRPVGTVRGRRDARIDDDGAKAARGSNSTRRASFPAPWPVWPTSPTPR
jgi:hypothetical protein